MPPRIFIFLIAMGANYSFELNSIETQFFGHDLFLGSASGQQNSCPIHLVTFILKSILTTDYIQIDIKLKVTTWIGHKKQP